MDQLTLDRATAIVLDSLAAQDNPSHRDLADQGQQLLAHHTPGNQMAEKALLLFRSDPQDQEVRSLVVKRLVAAFAQNNAATQVLITLAQQILARNPQSNGGQRGGVHLGSGNQFGDVSFGDIAGGNITKDTYTIGDITGSSGVAIGRGAQSIGRHIDTGGGDYSEGNIDKRKGTFVSGDHINLSGNFSGSNLNIKSTLTNVTQSIGASLHGDAAAKAELQKLIEQLNAELQKVPPEKVSEAEAVAETAKAAVEQAIKEKPNKTMVQISADGLKAAAQNLLAVTPMAVQIATQIAEAIKRFVP